MALFQFKCQQCGQVIEGDDSFSGQVAACPYCGKNIVIPNVDNSSNTGKQASQKNVTFFWRWIRKYFTFKGRAQRKEFWITQGVFLTCQLLLHFSIFLARLNLKMWILVGGAVLFGIPFILSLIGALCTNIRRLHDLNRSGWWVLPFNIGTFITFWMSENSLDDDFLSILAGLIPIAWIIVHGTLDGTPGVNDYGSDPKGRIGPGRHTNAAEIAIWILSGLSIISATIAIENHPSMSKASRHEEMENEDQQLSSTEEQSEEVNELGADTLRKGLSEAFQEQGRYLSVGSILEFSLVKANGNTYNGLARVKIHTAKGTSASAVVRYSLEGTYDGINIVLSWQALSADVDKLGKLLKQAGYEE